MRKYLLNLEFEIVLGLIKKRSTDNFSKNGKMKK